MFAPPLTLHNLFGKITSVLFSEFSKNFKISKKYGGDFIKITFKILLEYKKLFHATKITLKHTFFKHNDINNRIKNLFSHNDFSLLFCICH